MLRGRVPGQVLYGSLHTTEAARRSLPDEGA